MRQAVVFEDKVGANYFSAAALGDVTRDADLCRRDRSRSIKWRLLAA
jgi:hypothetical protein